MQVSTYNFFTSVDAGVIVYNAAEGTFTRVDAPTALALKRRSVPALPPDSLAKLVAAGVLHDGNQRTRIQGRFDLNRFATTHINITLAPTIECNLACWYCYQNNRRYIGAMDQATQDA